MERRDFVFDVTYLLYYVHALSNSEFMYVYKKEKKNCGLQ